MYQYLTTQLRLREIFNSEITEGKKLQILLHCYKYLHQQKISHTVEMYKLTIRKVFMIKSSKNAFTYLKLGTGIRGRKVDFNTFISQWKLARGIKRHFCELLLIPQ